MSTRLTAGPLVDPTSVPGWLALLVRRTAELSRVDLGDDVGWSPDELQRAPEGGRADFVVTPVLGHGERPGPVAPVDHRETAAVARVPLRALVDPVNRLIVRRSSGYPQPALLPGMLVWGFTGELLAALLAMGGWERPWKPTTEYGLDVAWRLAERTEVV